MLFEIKRKAVRLYKKIRRMMLKAPRLKFVYAWYYKHSKIQEKQILFESFHGKGISDSPLYMLYELLKYEDADQYKIYFATNDLKKHREFVKTLNHKIELVDITTYKYSKILATSKYLINNSSFPAFFVRREEQVYLQTWHGTPLKTLGKKMRFGIESMYNVQHNFLHASHIMFPNEFTKDVMMNDYNLDSLYTGKVVLNGYPRNSIFMDQKKADEICSKLGNEEYTTLAYMPTWRGQSNHDIQIDNYAQEVHGILQYLDEQLTDKQKLYVNFHPIVAASVTLGNYKHILPFPVEVDQYQFLNSVDALITDYSSVFFDFSITRKPIILFMYDYEEYLHDRGLYFDIKELPFRKIYNKEDLAACIVSEDFRKDDYSNDQEYINKYIQYDSIDAGKRMLDLVIKGEESGLKITDYSENKNHRRRVLFPSGIKTINRMDSLARCVDSERDLVVFEKRYFGPVMSSHLHDTYPDDFDYMFITKTCPRTYWEECRKNDEKTKDVIAQRSLQYYFPGLDVGGEYLTDYYHGDIGEEFSIEPVDLPAKLSVADHYFYGKYELPAELSESKLVLVWKNTIIWNREISDEEKKNSTIRENFRSFLDGNYARKDYQYRMAIEVINQEGRKSLCYLLDETRYENVKTQIDDLNQSALCLEEIPHTNVSYVDGVLRDSISTIPCQEKTTGRAALKVCNAKEATGKYIRSQVIKLSTKGSVLKIKIKMKKNAEIIKDVRLSYRSEIEEIYYSMNYQVSENSKYWIISASLDVSKVDLKSLYWDVFVMIEQEGKISAISSFLNAFQYNKILVGDQQCNLSDNFVLYPYRTKGGKLAYLYREDNGYDDKKTNIKQLAAYCEYAIFLPFWKKKRLWLVFEKFSGMAQDNGYYFFKYCMENLPEEEKKHIYY
ncbi:MAG: CDP-glycerol glycerophosphotransferase family protein, partial [Lachnospiraceae bacterium]|nr:CDP-glycerol glycerophosphotransferase family protein [Lachnospiraceae bacterium]